MRSKLKSTGKIAGRVLVGIAAFVLVYFLAAFSFSRITLGTQDEGTKEVTIYIKTNGVHTDIVVPAHNELANWTSEIKYTNTAGADSTHKYVAFGWGDKGFYLQTPTWDDLKFSVAFNAAFWLSSSAIHATYYSHMPVNEQCRQINISKAQYARLVAYIQNSFRHDAQGHVMHINTTANYGATDAFYEAEGSYSLLRTCNTWANSALRACGQKCCLWTIFDTGIFLKYK